MKVYIAMPYNYPHRCFNEKKKAEEYILTYFKNKEDKKPIELIKANMNTYIKEMEVE